MRDIELELEVNPNIPRGKMLQIGEGRFVCHPADKTLLMDAVNEQAENAVYGYNPFETFPETLVRALKEHGYPSPFHIVEEPTKPFQSDFDFNNWIRE